MTTYTAHGLPKPEPTDLISQGYDAIGDLAEAVDALLPSYPPIGSIVMWATATPPTGWLICNGSTFTAATYPALNTLLGGNTLPDLRDRVPVGASTTKAVKTTGGAASVTLTATELPNHAHTVPNHTHPMSTIDGGSSAGTSLARVAQGGGTASTITPGGNTGGSGAFATTAAGSGSAFSVQNPYLALNFIIRAA